VTDDLIGSVLGRFVRGADAAADATRERCDLCDDPVRAGHRHLFEPATRGVSCVCLPCSVLFDRGRTGTGRYRLIPERRLRLATDVPSDEAWAGLGIPVGIAFLVAAERRLGSGVVAAYPSPVGAIESPIPAGVWAEVVAAEPVLATLEPETEALLVNRARGARSAWLVPIDDCFRLVALVRTSWRGLGGGTAAWRGIAGFFDDLDRRARPALTGAGPTDPPERRTGTTPPPSTPPPSTPPVSPEVQP
jgi:hypothetical protein